MQDCPEERRPEETPSQAKARLHREYLKDSEDLWARHHRSAGTPPTDAYVREKRGLLDRLKEDLAKTDR